MNKILAVFTLVTLLASAPAAFAQELSAMQRAEQETIAGSKAESDGDLPRALSHYTKAVDLFPAGGVALRKARLLAKMHRLVEARAVYRAIVDRGVTASTPAEQQERRSLSEATQELQAITGRIPKIAFAVSGAKDPVVSLDGATLKDLGAASEVDPGRHTVKVSAPGFRVLERTFDVAEKETIRLDLTLVAESAPKPVDSDGDGIPDTEDACKTEPGVATANPRTNGCPAVGVTPPIVASPPPVPPLPSRTVAYVALTVGGVGAVVGSITGIMTLSKASSLKDACPTKMGCDQSTLDSAKTLGTVSTIAFVVGAAGLGYGTYALLSTPSEKVRVSVGPGSVSVGGKF